MSEPAASDPLQALTARLEQLAARLRAEDVDADEAAELVEESARVATEATAELERRARAAGQDA
jgi:hypothetical protein